MVISRRICGVGWCGQKAADGHDRCWMHHVAGDDCLIGRKCEIDGCGRLVETMTLAGRNGSERFCYLHRTHENPCPVCIHPEETAIELAMATMEMRKDIADRFDVPRNALEFHRVVCRPDLTLKANRPCQVCASSDVQEIERMAAIKGQASRAAKTYGVNYQALCNHMASHIDDPERAMRIALQETERLATIRKILESAS